MKTNLLWSCASTEQAELSTQNLQLLSANDRLLFTSWDNCCRSSDVHLSCVTALNLVQSGTSASGQVSF